MLKSHLHFFKKTQHHFKSVLLLINHVKKDTKEFLYKGTSGLFYL